MTLELQLLDPYVPIQLILLRIVRVFLYHQLIQVPIQKICHVHINSLVNPVKELE
jgi:hypothetical protein